MTGHQGDDVTDFYEILRQKETDYARLRKEVEALRLVAPLLDPEGGLSQADEEEPQTLDEIITRERALSEPATSPESAVPEMPGDESAPGENASESERKGPLSESHSQTSWWRRLQSGT
jgi:hypothetical protein